MNRNVRSYIDGILPKGPYLQDTFWQDTIDICYINYYISSDFTFNPHTKGSTANVGRTEMGKQDYYARDGKHKDKTIGH